MNIVRDAQGLIHPRDEQEVVALIHHARACGLSVRVRGSGHSIPASIHADTRLRGQLDGALELSLDRLIATRFDDARKRVTVGAGCRLGPDFSGRGHEGPGLLQQLHARGWALPNLGGITHQTVSGFFNTGSAGGSVMYGFAHCLVALRLVDGLGQVHVLSREDTPDRLDAVAVSMGLCGVITELTLECIDAYDVVGEELIFDDALPDFDPFADGEQGFEALLRREPYARLLWWPQPRVNRFQLWRAKRMEAADYEGARDADGKLIPIVYSPIEPIAGSIEVAQQAAAVALGMLGGWRQGLAQALTPQLVDSLEWLGAEKLEASLLRAFTPLTPPRKFRGPWHEALPMDDPMNDELLPTSFTELWIPIEHTGEVMRRLKKLYAEVPGAAGHFATELYAGATSSFWLAPGNARPTVRLNPFWYDGFPGDPRATVFAHLFELFDDLGYRLHWAKALPLDAQASSRQLAKQFPRWNDFLAMRNALDPDGLFLTSYWSAHLGLSDAAPTDAHSIALQRTNFLPRPADLRFALLPCDESLLETAMRKIELEGVIPAPRHEVRAVFDDLPRSVEWMPGFIRADFHSVEREGRGAHFDEIFSFMTMRLRVTRSTPGEWVAVTEGCSLPLATRMIQQVAFEETPEGHTRMRWIIAFDLLKVMNTFAPPVLVLFKAWFERGLKNLGRLEWTTRRAA
ncbi:MAG: D-arabinono-1,4-lactone oxidase [Archangium sp.]